MNFTSCREHRQESDYDAIVRLTLQQRELTREEPFIPVENRREDRFAVRVSSAEKEKITFKEERTSKKINAMPR
jgi:predicted nucleotidyltransferase